MRINDKQRIDLEELGCLCKYCRIKKCPYLITKKILKEIVKDIKR